MSGRIGGPSHSDRTLQFNWKRTLTVYSCAWEQTEENTNMLFVMSDMRNVQKHIRDHGGVFSVTMNWSRLVTMSYVICRYVLTCGGVPGNIWEVHSGLIVQKVVLSVRGCLMWGISEWGCFVSRKFMVSYFQSPVWVIWECGKMSIFCTRMDGGGWSVAMRWLCWWTLLCHSILQSKFLEILTDWWKIVLHALIGNPELFGLVCGVADRPMNISWCWGG
jgi:hypothetical protein